MTAKKIVEDGSSAPRNTWFVLEDGVWKHRFTQEEDLFEPGVSFQEFSRH